MHNSLEKDKILSGNLIHLEFNHFGLFLHTSNFNGTPTLMDIIQFEKEKKIKFICLLNYLDRRRVSNFIGHSS